MIATALAAGVSLAPWWGDLTERGTAEHTPVPTDRAADEAAVPPERDASLDRAAQDLLYVADGEGGADHLVVVAMPEGQVIEQFDFPALSGSRNAVPTPHVAEEFAFFARTIAEGPRLFRTSLVRIDLRTGQRRSVEVGAVEYSGPLVLGGDHEARSEDMSEAERDRRLRSYAEQVARSYAQVVASPDAATVLLVRDRAGTSSTIRVDRFDGRSLAHLGTRIWTEVASFERFFAIDADRSLAIRYEHPDLFSQRQIWTFLDRELREVATVTGAMPVDWPNYCSPDLRALPDGRTWVTICDRHSRSYFLQFIDRERLADAGTVELTAEPRYPADLLAWHVATDGTIVVLTDRPSLIRVDPVGRRVIDHRLITLDTFSRTAEPVRSTAFPRVQFSADGRYVYVTYLGYGGRSWWAPLSLVDVRSGRTVATALDGPGVTAVHLSSDGARLYLIQDGRVVVLDPGDLRVVSVTEPIVRPPGSLLIVASRD